MSDTYRYCQNCGKLLSPQARYCGSCGAAAFTPASSQANTVPVAARQAQVAPAQMTTAPLGSASSAATPVHAAAPSESILGVIPGALRKSGFLGMHSEAFHIVVTSQRLIFARQTDEMMKANIQQARVAARENGKGFLGQWGAQLNANTGAQYLQMQPQMILSEQADNFFVYNNQVREARVHKSRDDETLRTDYSLKLKTTSGDIHMSFSNFDEKASRQVLRLALGHAFR
jgi:hypothetical protein